MVQGMKLKLGGSQTRGRSTGSPDKKKTFPVTPRSVEKQKNIL
jgi:hypothetical protein